MKTLFCNEFQLSHKKEVFLLLFKFVAPDGKEDAVYVALSPSGAATLHEILEKDIETYIKDFGNIALGNWKTNNTPTDCNSKNPTYLT